MMELFQILGFLGTTLVAIAYLPQIVHMVRRHCAYGLDPKAWLIWLLAALFIFPHAIATGDVVFIALQLINIVAIIFIVIFSFRHQSRVCKKHKHALL